MKKIKILSLLTLIILFSCSQNGLENIKYTVILNDETGDFIFENSTPTTLSETEIVEIESIIGCLVSNHINTYGFTTSMAENENGEQFFYRQYLPVILGNNEKAVWINFFCSNRKFENWQKELVIVGDGGPCYFQVSVNLDKKIYFDYNVHH